MIGVSILLVGTIYIQYFELFTQDIYIQLANASEDLTPRELFAKILQTILILVATYSAAFWYSGVPDFLPLKLSKAK